MSLLSQLKKLVIRAWKWYFPMPGWKSRIAEARSGAAFPVNGRPEMDDFYPWPPEWCVWEVIEPEQEGQKARPRFLDTISEETGREATGDEAVRCARCGIHLHASEANMRTNVDVPSCIWCRPAVLNRCF